MLIISILISAIAVSLFSSKTLSTDGAVTGHLTSIHFSRSTTLIILLCVLLVPSLNFDINNIGLFHSLFTTSNYQIVLDLILYSVIIVILLSINPMLTLAYNSNFYLPGPGYNPVSKSSTLNFVIKPELSIIILFMVLGSTLLLSSYDLISVYLTLELQSFALYLIASLRTDLISSTGAGLKYFLLGAISSAFIILGISLVYQVFGTTNFQTLSTLIVSLNDANLTDTQTVSLGLLLILSGLMFKISAAPFHNWFADVIQDVPTFVGIIIMNIPKISVLSLIIYLVNYVMFSTPLFGTLNPITLFLWIVIVFSLVLGTVAGLVQSKVKRLLAFSTISHVGFILMAFLGSNETFNPGFGLTSLVFYLGQYLVTILLTLIILTAFETSYFKRSINNITDLVNIFKSNPTLTFTFILCLFSIAGIPPLTGFFAKFGVLKSALISSSYLIAFLAIFSSLISASYYMRLIKLIVFQNDSGNVTIADSNAIKKTSTDVLNNIHSDINPVIAYAISVLTFIMVFYILDQSLIINSLELMALSVSSSIDFN